jgi:hypothetical protein
LPLLTPPLPLIAVFEMAPSSPPLHFVDFLSLRAIDMPLFRHYISRFHCHACHCRWLMPRAADADAISFRHYFDTTLMPLRLSLSRRRCHCHFTPLSIFSSPADYLIFFELILIFHHLAFRYYYFHDYFFIPSHCLRWLSMIRRHIDAFAFIRYID